MTLAIVLLVVLTTVWVGFDATKREWGDKDGSPFAWVAGCILLWVIVFPLYLIRRRNTPLKASV